MTSADRVPETAPAVRLDATVRGRVQGVGFRYYVLRRAMGLGLRGWVANERDGSVRCVAEGPPEAVETLLGILEHGPAGSLVERVDVTRGAASGSFASFEIRSGGHSGD
jgi:acylphosphatase